MAAVAVPKTKAHQGRPAWGWRRVIVIPVIIFGLWQLMELRDSKDTRVNETLANGWMLLVAALALGISGLGTVQDVAAIWVTKSGLPYDPNSSPAPQPPPPDVTVESGATVEVKAG